MNQQNLFIISDYGTGDAAFAEVILQLRMVLFDTFIYPISTPPFSTINTGFWIQQIALSPGIKNTFIYSNTAPRKENTSAQKNNMGEKLMYAQLQNGVELMAINAGYTFSFIKQAITAFHFVQVENEGSQFRSRDKYPKAVAQMLQGEKSFLGEKAEIETIPDYAENRIASIDGYGNIKITTRKSRVPYSPGQKLNISLNGVTHRATFTDGSFNIPAGELAFAPGSSGHTDWFMELFLRGSSAAELFKKPAVEDTITVSLAT